MKIIPKNQKIQQPDCIDENGHLILQPIIDIAKDFDCPFIALIGEKRIGKTYGCFNYGLHEHYKDGSSMFYARRYDKTFTENICGNLVSVHRQDIINLSGGKQNHGELKGKYFDLVRKEMKNDGTEVKKNRKHFAFCRSLNNIETETADDKENISCIVYDEFLTRGNELKDEFNKLMILHANATGKRTNKFVPMFLCGNTVNRESIVAECFGIDLRRMKRGLNICTNSKGECRCIVFYSPETSKSTKAAKTYYDRFENDHINMIAHGDWTIGSYRVASQHEMSLTGFSILARHKSLTVKITIATDGIQPRVIISKPDNIYNMRIDSNLSKNAINYLPKKICEFILNGFLVVETPEIGENFRDICKHIQNGKQIVNFIE